jgi:hypothetical protein
MNSLNEIELEIKRLEEKLHRIKSRKTEVYSRIVGYYRSVSNWNQGKRAEFDERRAFEVREAQPAASRYAKREAEAVLSA